ncbi:MAG: transposase [Gammaproteobacteria bacterium]
MYLSIHGRSLRKGRISCQGQVYLVTTVTANRQPLFGDFQIGRVVVHEIMRADRHGLSETMAFVVMPDHVHWMFSPVGNISLSSVVGGMKRHSARQANTTLHRQGYSVWQRGFHDRALRSEESVLDTARYIIANPLRAGLVDHVGMYPLRDTVFVL